MSRRQRMPLRQHCSFKVASEGAAAVEFALVLPFLLLLVFGTFAAGALTATISGLEQISAGAARSTVAGQSEAERTSLANSFISSNVQSYPYIDARSLTVTTTDSATTRTFTVKLDYDLSGNRVLSAIKSLIPGLPSSFTRSAVVVEGGT